MRYSSKAIVSLLGALCAAGTLLFLLPSRASRLAQPAGTQLTVMTYNIHQGFDNAGRDDPRKFLRSIHEVDPDIVGVQESETNRLLQGSYDLVFWLASHLDMSYCYGPPTKEQTYGVALLSKYPLRDCATTLLPSVEDQRALVEATITSKGQDVRVMVIHLGLSVEDRFQQLRWIFEEKIAKATLPIILMGDFNTTEDEDFTLRAMPPLQKDAWFAQRLAQQQRHAAENEKKGIFRMAQASNFRGLADYRAVLVDAWRHAHPEDRSAYSWSESDMDPATAPPTVEPPNRLDFIFVSKEFEILDAQILTDRNTLAASDHLPVTARLNLAEHTPR
jgi:endonuclease/exonuclease/phosphatase family metal-dependent hydrolase